VRVAMIDALNFLRQRQAEISDITCSDVDLTPLSLCAGAGYIDSLC
jgi:hypothetical protein